jgi:PIN domain nuclease of toxin-antitoxin system
LWVSPISSWEIVLLVEKGRLQLEMEAEAWLGACLRTVGLREAPVTHEVVFQARGIQLPHRDPADRLLAATALVYGLTLVTADERLLACPALATLANR